MGGGVEGADPNRGRVVTNPDEIPTWFFIPTALAVWAAWLAPAILRRLRARRGRCPPTISRSEPKGTS